MIANINNFISISRPDLFSAKSARAQPNIEHESRNNEPLGPNPSCDKGICNGSNEKYGFGEMRTNNRSIAGMTRRYNALQRRMPSIRSRKINPLSTTKTGGTGVSPVHYIIITYHLFHLHDDPIIARSTSFLTPLPLREGLGEGTAFK